jgi:hypothetical protein
MPKRAVLVSFQLWKEWLTQGFRASNIECTKGLPEDAVLLGTFEKPSVIRGVVTVPELVAVFESPSLEPYRDGEYTVTTPDGDELPLITPEFTVRELREQYSVISWDEGGVDRKIAIRSTGHPSVLFNWRPDHGQGCNPLVDDPSCQYEVEWLC